MDNPANIHPKLQQSIAECEPPYQSTRPDQPGRGHYLFQQPPGRDLGNSLGRLANGWGEARGRNGVIIVAPSEHGEGGCYQWLRTGPVPVLPDYVAELLPDALDAEEAATDAQVTAFLAEHRDSGRPELLDIHLAAWHKKITAGESRHGTVMGHIAGAMKEAKAGLIDAEYAAASFETIFVPAIMQQPIGPKQGKARTAAEAKNEWAGILAWAVAQGLASDPAATHERVNKKVPKDPLEGLTSPKAAGNGPTSSNAERDRRLAGLAQVLTQLRTWQHLPDPAHVIATLAAAATRRADGEPCWLLMVAPPSSGKTETARLLDDVADARLNEVTAAGLLSWSKGKDVKPTGILTRIGKLALVTFGDLSSLLATSDRGGRDQVFSLLRRAYDGHATRDIAPPGKTDNNQQLAWSGRLTVVACVTGAIDRYSAHANELGPRWVYVRIPERTTRQKRQAAQLARRSDLATHRAAARKAVAELLAQLPAQLPDLPDGIADEIEDAALVTTWGRGAVPRNGYGRREMEDVPVVEEPMRLIQQLGGIARGVLALGLPAAAAAAIARRIALDSMPAARHAVLAALSTGEAYSTAGCARAAHLDRKVARMALEELAAIGVVENDRSDEEDDPIGVVNWRLSGDDGAIVGSVFKAHRASGAGWDEVWVDPQ